MNHEIISESCPYSMSRTCSLDNECAPHEQDFQNRRHSR
ncbi:protein of unknown function [Pseudomonas sp. JV241A]|nr:protein of unknown function [Pseudomonas sp. JV241A]